MDKGRTHRTLRGLAVVASSSFLALAAVGTATAHPLVADTRDDDVTAGDSLAALICSYDACDDADELAARIDQLLGGFSLIDESTDASADEAETDSAETEDDSSDRATDDSNDSEEGADHESDQHDSGDAEDDSNDNEDHAGSDTEDHDSGDAEDGGDSHDD